MKKHMFILPVFLVAVVALILGAAVPGVQAQDDPECFFNIELNASDLDVGVRGFFDYEPWYVLAIVDPIPVPIAAVGALADGLLSQGFAEWFFESGEPKLGEPEYEGGPIFTFLGFLARFPEGDYVFNALPNDGDPVDCTAKFTHVIPCAPEISASGNRGLGVTISWDDVTEVVNPGATDTSIGLGGDEVVCMAAPDPPPAAPSFEIVGWEVIVETEVEVEVDGNGEVKTYIYEIDLPADARSVKVPPEFIALGEEFQYEVLAIEGFGNQTITEEEFCINELNGHVVECEENGD